MRNNIVLIGLPGSGKTTVGRELAKHGYDFVDIDEEIERETGLSISEIFAQHGEEYFRKLESEKIKELSIQASSHLSISIGGGAFESEENRKNLLANAFVVYLKADPATIDERIKAETHRPLLKTVSISDLLEQRGNNYLQAHCTIDTVGKTPYNIVNEILGALND